MTTMTSRRSLIEAKAGLQLMITAYNFCHDDGIRIESSDGLAHIHRPASFVAHFFWTSEIFT